MPIIKNIQLSITVEDVLRFQGANPETIAKRKPKLIQITENALQIGLPLLHPQILFEKYTIESIKNGQINLLGGETISNKFLSHQLTSTEEILVAVCTVGKEIENYGSENFNKYPVISFAMDAIGSIAIENLTNVFCRITEQKAKADGKQTTIPLNPGMVGWSIDVGQRTIFKLLNCSQIGVSLTEDAMMIPRKSLSLLIGIGEHLHNSGKSVCDFCPKRDTCKYREKLLY